MRFIHFGPNIDFVLTVANGRLLSCEVDGRPLALLAHALNFTFLWCLFYQTLFHVFHLPVKLVSESNVRCFCWAYFQMFAVWFHSFVNFTGGCRGTNIFNVIRGPIERQPLIEKAIEVFSISSVYSGSLKRFVHIIVTFVEQFCSQLLIIRLLDHQSTSWHTIIKASLRNDSDHRLSLRPTMRWSTW